MLIVRIIISDGLPMPHRAKEFVFCYQKRQDSFNKSPLKQTNASPVRSLGGAFLNSALFIGSKTRFCRDRV